MLSVKKIKEVIHVSFNKIVQLSQYLIKVIDHYFFLTENIELCQLRFLLSVFIHTSALAARTVGIQAEYAFLSLPDVKTCGLR